MNTQVDSAVTVFRINGKSVSSTEYYNRTRPVLTRVKHKGWNPLYKDGEFSGYVCDTCGRHSDNPEAYCTVSIPADETVTSATIGYE